MKQIANPTYDAVFKYLMEDPAIAQFMLRTLLQREVYDVTLRPQEFTSERQSKPKDGSDDQPLDHISLLRIDFAATVKEKTGELRRIHIEMQRRWVETEIIRFRQYLGTQYKDPANILRPEDSKSGNKRYGIPIVTIYLLGNCLDEIKEPILYVRHKHFDYQNNEIAKDVRDPFIESLVHDTIIVQIPLLKQHREGRLFEVLSIFNQGRKDGKNGKILNLEDGAYQGDTEMQMIVHRLGAACYNAEVQSKMDIEDEFNMAFDIREAAIAELDGKLAERNEQLAKRDEQLAERDEQLAERDEQLAERDEQLAERDEQLAERTEQLAERDEQLAERNEQLAERNEQLAERNEQLAKRDEQLAEQDEKIAEQDEKITKQGEKLAEQGEKITKQGEKLAAQEKALTNWAKSLLAQGMELSKIAEITTLPIDAIERLR